MPPLLKIEQTDLLLNISVFEKVNDLLLIKTVLCMGISISYGKDLLYLFFTLM
jgi:hypothetical protein